jgi:hypothetical protein
MSDFSFKQWLLQTELVNPGEPPPTMDMAAMIRKSGGGAMLTGEAPPRPWDGPGGVTTPRPKIHNSQNNGWAGGKRQIARRIKPITPTGRFMAKPPSPV